MPVSAESIQNSRILIVDDSEFNRFLLKQIFENNGFHTIVSAHNGIEALEKVHSFAPQLIVLDLMMPQMDGYEFCQKLREIAEFKNTPVLVQTSVDSQQDRNKIFRLGATDLVTKPVNADELMARARVHLENLHLLVSLQQYRTRIASELSQAKEMQNDLMPDATLIAHYRKAYQIDIAYHFETSSEMGGDMWGARPVDEHRLAVFMSDLSGHGITAALNAFRLHTLMQELISEYGSDPGRYLSTLSKRLEPLLGKAQFATMFYGVVDTQSGQLHYATAATPHPLMFRSKSATFEKLVGTGYPLAILDPHYSSQNTLFGKGDILILYSDAFIETRWKDGTFLSEDKMMGYLDDALKKGMLPTATAVRDTLLEYFHAHAELPIKDDLTLSVYQRL